MRPGNFKSLTPYHTFAGSDWGPTREHAMLGRLRIGPKLLLAPGLVLVLLLVSSGGAYWAMERQNSALESVVQVRAARIKDATDLVNEAQAAHARSYRLLGWIGSSFAPSRIDALWAVISQRHEANTRAFTRLVAGAPAGSRERILATRAAAAHGAYVAALREAVELARADDAIGSSAMGKAEHAFDTAAGALAALSQLEQSLSEQALQAAAAEVKLMSLSMALLAALSLGLTLAVSLAVRRQMLDQVGVIGQAAASLASGNMTVPARDYGSDELSDTARALDASILGLNGSLRTILDAARALDLASRRMVALERDAPPCAVMQLDHLPHGAPAQVHGAAQAAHSLQQQALELARAVAQFKLEPAGKDAYGRPKLRLAADRGQLQEDDAR